ADFDNVIERSPEGLQQYAGIVARMAGAENMPAFHRSAVAALAEHGVRIASSGGMLTTRFTRIADIAREAAFLASERDGEKAVVARGDVEEAVVRTKRRADLPSRRFRKHLREGTIHVQTQGEKVGQVNGLAVIHSGPITYGFPARITATIGPGNAGIIDIEGRSALSGSIHTKGVQILGGLVRHLLQTDHPLAFSASLAFEQSYGGIDGDSASGAEICCLLSALSDVPLRQDLSMTGAIDQFGRIQAIGGVNEKIEGFYDTCFDAGLTGTQGVLIPQSNADDLMLRRDVAEACAEGSFHIYAVETIHQALELFTGMPAGELDEYDEYPEDSLLAIAVGQALHYWERTLQNPAQLLAALRQQQEDEALALEEGEGEEEDEEEIAAEA
ncbi:MAG: Lon-insertion domain-containing protein, partial [Planctomycetota bacterium]